MLISVALNYEEEQALIGKTIAKVKNCGNVVFTFDDGTEVEMSGDDGVELLRYEEATYANYEEGSQVLDDKKQYCGVWSENIIEIWEDNKKLDVKIIAKDRPSKNNTPVLVWTEHAATKFDLFARYYCWWTQ